MLKTENYLNRQLSKATSISLQKVRTIKCKPVYTQERPYNKKIHLSNKERPYRLLCKHNSVILYVEYFFLLPKLTNKVHVFFGFYIYYILIHYELIIRRIIPNGIFEGLIHV